MAKIVDLDIGNKEEVCKVAKALSSPVRLDILSMLYCGGMIISEIAKQPESSDMRILPAAFITQTVSKQGFCGAREVL